MLQIAVRRFVFGLLDFPQGSRAGETLEFFIYDSIKIIALLFVMISLVAFLRTFLPQHKIKSWITRQKNMANIYAAMFGALTPFCSCSSIPIFISFLRAGVPLGVTFSFLVTSPIVNEYLAVLMLGFFGFRITALYVLSGILIGVVTGIVLGKLKLEYLIEKDIWATDLSEPKEQLFKSLKSRAGFALAESGSIVKKLWIWVLFGVGLGALIHNFVPSELIQDTVARTGIFSVPVATLLGVPIYGSCAAIVPIAVVLFQKGMPLGTALSFMMAVAALSFPEAVLLRRAMRLKLIALFFAISALAIMLTGYLFNLLERVLL